MDLAKANKRPHETPVWRYLYSAKEAYQVTILGRSTPDYFSTSWRVWNLAPGQTLSSNYKPILPCLSVSISSTIGLNSDHRFIANCSLNALLVDQSGSILTHSPPVPALFDPIATWPVDTRSSAKQSLQGLSMFHWSLLFSQFFRSHSTEETCKDLRVRRDAGHTWFDSISDIFSFS